MPRKTVGYLAAQLPEEPDWTDKMKGGVGRACPKTIENWYIDAAEHTDAFRKLIMQMNRGGIGAVAYMGDNFLPDDPVLVGEFYDAALEEDVELYAEQGTTYPERKLLAQIGALLAGHERTAEEWFLNKRNQGCLYFNIGELPELRRMCEADGGKLAKSFLHQTQHIELEDAPEKED